MSKSLCFNSEQLLGLIREFIPKLGLDIIPIADLLQRSEDSDFLVDVMGLLTSVTDEKEYEKDGKKTKMVVIELGENDDRIRCALFGDYVDQLNRYLSSGYAEQPVLLLQLAKVKVYRGKVGLQNVMFASKLGFNLDIPKVASFRQSSIPQGLMASQPMGFVDAGKKVDIEEDFVRLTPRCTIKSLEEDVLEGAFVVLGQITEIVKDGPWWYSACVCGRSVIAESGLYFCQFCKTHVTNVTPRVKVLVEDPSGATIFVLFDREATYLLKKACVQFFEMYKKNSDVLFGGQCPCGFKDLVGKSLLFKIYCRPTGTEKYRGTFPVRRVCDDAAIVGMFQSLEPALIGTQVDDLSEYPSEIGKTPEPCFKVPGCSQSSIGSGECTESSSFVVDLSADDDIKCPILMRKPYNPSKNVDTEEIASIGLADKDVMSSEDNLSEAEKNSAGSQDELNCPLKKFKRIWL